MNKITEMLLKPFLQNKTEIVDAMDLSTVAPEYIDKELTDDLDLAHIIASSNTSVSEELERLSSSDLIQVYRSIFNSPDGGDAVDEIVNEFLSGIDDETIRIDFGDAEISEAIKKKIEESFNDILQLMNFKNNGHDIFKDWYVDGSLAVECIYDNNNMKKGIQKIVILTPHNLYKKYNERTKETEYMYSGDNSGHQQSYWTTNYNGDLVYKKDQLIWLDAGLRDHKGRRVGYLNRCVKPFNQLSMIEDIIVVYRLTRGTEKRVFKVNVGNMPKAKAVTYMQELISKFKFSKSYNSETGEVQNDSHLISLTEDIWLPTKNSAKDIEIDTVGSGMNLGELEDIKYFRDKFTKSLKVPASRLGNSEDGMPMDITATEISRDELRFLNYIFKLRGKFNNLFLELLKRELVSRNIMTEQEYNQIRELIRFMYPDDSKFSEIKKLETLSKRMEVLQDVEEYVGKYFSRKYVKKNILNFSDEEIENMQKEIDEEKKAGEYDEPEE